MRVSQTVLLIPCRLCAWPSLLILTAAFPQNTCQAAALAVGALAPTQSAFVIENTSSPAAMTPRVTFLRALGDNGEDEAAGLDNLDTLYMERFKRRREEVHARTMQKEWRRPPNPFLDPYQLVAEILDVLRHPDAHDPESGVKTLLRASTVSWRDVLRRSVGAPPDSSDDDAALALRPALGRFNNQFGILVAAPDAEEYTVSFPTDALDYDDGTCWVECRLRGAENDTLLVVMGWSLRRRDSDGAWLVEAIDWQDFRDGFRPGIGREEWERICG